MSHIFFKPSIMCFDVGYILEDFEYALIPNPYLILPVWSRVTLNICYFTAKNYEHVLPLCHLLLCVSSLHNKVELFI